MNKKPASRWLWLLAILSVMISAGCFPQDLEGVMTRLLPLGDNPRQRAAVEITLTSDQLRNDYVYQETCEYFQYSDQTRLRYFSTGTFSSRVWFDNPISTLFAEFATTLNEDQDFLWFRKFYIPELTIISGTSNFDAKCYHDGGFYPELDEFYCRGGADLDFTGEQLCVFFDDDRANNQIVVSGRPCEGSYFFAGCDKDCKERGDWTTPETIIAEFDADVLTIIQAETFWDGTTVNETIEIPGTCGSSHRINISLTTSQPGQ